MSNNTCNCPNPPGGLVVCEPHQMAVCIVKDGQARHQCLDPIDSNNPHVLVNWALSKIKVGRIRHYRRSRSKVTSENLLLLLDEKYVSRGISVTFSLPPEIRDAVHELLDNRDDDDKAIEMVTT